MLCFRIDLALMLMSIVGTRLKLTLGGDVSCQGCEERLTSTGKGSGGIHQGTEGQIPTKDTFTLLNKQARANF